MIVSRLAAGNLSPQADGLLPEEFLDPNTHNFAEAGRDPKHLNWIRLQFEIGFSDCKKLQMKTRQKFSLIRAREIFSLQFRLFPGQRRKVARNDHKFQIDFTPQQKSTSGDGWLWPSFRSSFPSSLSRHLSFLQEQYEWIPCWIANFGQCISDFRNPIASLPFLIESHRVIRSMDLMKRKTASVFPTAREPVKSVANFKVSVWISRDSGPSRLITI